MKRFFIFIFIFIFLFLSSFVSAVTTRYIDNVAEVSGGEVSFKVNDRLGSQRVIVDEGGEVVAEFKSLPYGQVVENSGSKYGFTGKEKDVSTGLHYFSARYYDSSTGRFAGVDSVKDNHPYSYVSNNPMNYVDPDGRDFNVDLANDFIDTSQSHQDIFKATYKLYKEFYDAGSTPEDLFIENTNWLLDKFNVYVGSNHYKYAKNDIPFGDRTYSSLVRDNSLGIVGCSSYVYKSLVAGFGKGSKFSKSLSKNLGMIELSNFLYESGWTPYYLSPQGDSSTENTYGRHGWTQQIASSRARKGTYLKRGGFKAKFKQENIIVGGDTGFSQEQKDRIAEIKFGVIMFQEGTHFAIIREGIVTEAHWNKDPFYPHGNMIDQVELHNNRYGLASDHWEGAVIFEAPPIN